MSSLSFFLVLAALAVGVQGGSLDLISCPNSWSIIDPNPVVGRGVFEAGFAPSPAPELAFQGNLVHYNVGNLMGGGLEGPYFTVDPNQPSSWDGGMNIMWGILVWLDVARTIQIGSGTISSDNWGVSPQYYAPDNYVIQFVGGYLHVQYTITPAGTAAVMAYVASQTNDYSNPKWNNFKGLDKQIYFQPQDSMPGAFAKPLMNRLISYPQALLYPSPNQVPQGFVSQSDTLMILWGSDGWVPSANNGAGAFENYSTGMDIVVELTCSNGGPGGNGVVSGGPCPDGACDTNYMANYPGCSATPSNPISGSNPTGTCVTLSFDASTSSTGCPRS